MRYILKIILDCRKSRKLKTFREEILLHVDVIASSFLKQPRPMITTHGDPPFYNLSLTWNDDLAWLNLPASQTL